MLTAKVDTLCDNCGLRTTHPTQTNALRSMQAHEDETEHDSQLFSTPYSSGWVRYRGPRYLADVK